MIYPGLPEAERAAATRRDGIVVDREHFDHLTRLADRFDVPLPTQLLVAA